MGRPMYETAHTLAGKSVYARRRHAAFRNLPGACQTGLSMTLARTDPRKNHLLGAIPEAEWERFAPHLTPVPLTLGAVVYESGTAQPYVYFPTDSIISLLYVMEDGASGEIAIVGNEGLVGISLFMGGNTTPSRAVVQSAGHAFRMKGQFIRDEFVLAGPVQQLFLRYTQALLTQMGQTAVCNRHHSVDQQLCRWLLMSLDRLSHDELTMTQELIANMLGVRREGVTDAAGKLQRAGMIQYTRGRIRVLDRPALEQRACECYKVVKAEFARLLPWDSGRDVELRDTPLNRRA
jgi:CRP-like cAMP-binding protein